MLNVIAEFAPARDSISWAKDAISEFDESAKRFFDGRTAQVVTDFDPKSGENVQKLRFRQPLPRELARKATEALTTTRHAFDQAAFAARNLTTGHSSKSVYFPWSQNPVDLERLLSKRFDQRLWNVFRAHEPYPRSHTHSGGDDIIRSLATLANNKHTVGLSIHAHILGMRLPSIHGKIVQSMKVLTPRWDSAKNEADLIRWIGDVEIDGNYEFRFEVVFKDAGLSQPVSAGDGLYAFFRKAEAVVKDLQARCLEIGE